MMSRLSVLLRSFRARLVIGYALVVVVMVALWAWSLYGPLTQAGIEQQRTDLVTVARVAALSVTDSSAPRAADAIARAARTSLRVTIVATDGVVLADSAENPSTMENHATRPEIAAALRGQVGTDTRTSATLGTEQMYVALPATVAGQPVALRVSEPLALVQGLADRGRQTGMLLLALALGVAIIAAYRLSASAAAPVLRLRNAAEAMAAGDLGTAIPAAEGEVGDLAQALTVLRDRIRATIGDMENSETMLRAALDGLQDAVLLVEGDRIAFTNRALATMFRAPGTARMGARLEDAGLPASLTAIILAHLNTDAARSEETGPDPEGRYHRVTIVPLNPGELGKRTLVVIADTSAPGRFDAMRRDFVANASHELKTPVAAIKLLAEAAESASEDGDAAQARAFTLQLRNEAERLRHLVADLLDLSRLEHGHRTGAVTDMRAAIGIALAGHHAAARDAGLSLECDTCGVEGEDVYAAADATDVAVALDNLLANAITYTDAGGVTVRLDADEQTVTIRVTDTGPGIAPEHLPRLFERFYRVDAARSRATGGTGLGLALVRNAVEVSGGTVDVASEVGKGTTFTLRLPRAK